MARKLLGLVFVLGLVLAGCGETTDNLKEAKEGEEPDSAVVDGTDKDNEEAEDDEAESQADEPEDLSIVESGFTALPPSDFAFVTGTYAVIIENPNPDRFVAESVQVTLSFYDDAGTVVASESDTVAAVLPGQRVAVTNATDGLETATRMEVQIRADSWEETDEALGSLVAEGVTVAADNSMSSFMDAPPQYTITGIVKSTFAEDLESVEANAVLRNAGGQIVGGAFTYVDFVPANGQTTFEITPSSGIVDVATAEVYFSPSFMTLFS